MVWHWNDKYQPDIESTKSWMALVRTLMAAHFSSSSCGSLSGTCSNMLGSICRDVMNCLQRHMQLFQSGHITGCFTALPPSLLPSVSVHIHHTQIVKVCISRTTPQWWNTLYEETSITHRWWWYRHWNTLTVEQPLGRNIQHTQTVMVCTPRTLKVSRFKVLFSFLPLGAR